MADPLDPKKFAGAPVSRRDMIKRGLALGGLSYVAPMIIGSATPVSAQPISGVGCNNLAENCADENALCLQENPNNENDCGCFNTVEDDPICVRLACGDECTDSDDCDPGWFCMDLPCDISGECPGREDRMCMEACSPGLVQFSNSGFNQRPRHSSWPPMARLS